MKPHWIFGACALFLCACEDTSANKPFSEQDKTDSLKLLTYCALDHATEFANQTGAPTELAVVAVQQCREEMVMNAYIWTQGNQKEAEQMMPMIFESTVRAATRQIVLERAK